MSKSQSPAINAVVLGANGAMGALFCRGFADEGIRVTAVDLSGEPGTQPQGVVYLRADVGKLTGEARAALAGADWVIAALPEAVLLEAWRPIVDAQRPGALFVDTMSVKKPIVDAMAGHLPSMEFVSINPMFAPSLGFRGQNVAVIEVARGQQADTFLAMLESWGARLCALTADQHDRYAALLQSASHAAILAFGLSLRKLDYDLPAVLPLMTPPHRALLALLARVLGASPEVYWEIQAQNPYAAQARQALRSGAEELSRLVDDGDQAGFRRLLDDLKDLYGAERLDEFNRYCARMISVKDGE